MRHVKSILLLLLIILVYASIYIIPEGKIGAVKGNKSFKPRTLTAGLHIIWPFITKVQIIDLRIHSEELHTDNLDYYVEWQVSDLPTYLAKNGTAINSIPKELETPIVNALKEPFTGNLSLLKSNFNDQAKSIGITITNLGIISTAGNHDNLSNEVLRRSKEVYANLAAKYRETNANKVKTIQTEADMEANNILQIANIKAAAIKAEGDMAASTIYGEAYNQNPEFYIWYKNLELYKKSLLNNSQALVLQPGGMILKKINE